MGVALLAPVPTMHLKSALATCAKYGKVAFGSNNPNVFDKLKEDFGLGVPVYIYASNDDQTHEARRKACLQGILCNVERAIDGGKHPKPIYRPDTTSEEVWRWFWEVNSLVELSDEDRIPLTKFTALGQTKPLPSGFVPRGPMIVKGAFIP